jgi:AraC-like DNA-binding protein
MRLIEAMPHVSTEKIEAIALKVGYKSKKNFYRAFQDVTGLTPTAFRNLSEERAFAPRRIDSGSPATPGPRGRPATVG